MISWVLDRIPARCAHTGVAHTVIIASEAETVADFKSGKAPIFAITENGLACERIGATEWYVSALGDRLLAERDLNQCACEAATRSPSTNPAIGQVMPSDSAPGA